MSQPGKSLRVFKRALEELSTVELEELVTLLQKYKEVYGAKRPGQISDLLISLAHGASSPRIDGYALLCALLSELELQKLRTAEQSGLSKFGSNAPHVNALREFRWFAEWALGLKNRLGLSENLKRQFALLLLATAAFASEAQAHAAMRSGQGIARRSLPGASTMAGLIFVVIGMQATSISPERLEDRDGSNSPDEELHARLTPKHAADHDAVIAEDTERLTLASPSLEPGMDARTQGVATQRPATIQSAPAPSPHGDFDHEKQNSVNLPDQPINSAPSNDLFVWWQGGPPGSSPSAQVQGYVAPAAPRHASTSEVPQPPLVQRPVTPPISPPPVGPPPPPVLPADVPRPIGPISTAIVRAGDLSWLNSLHSSGAVVELCESRDCASVARSFSVRGTSLRLPSDLKPGPWYWRLRALHDDGSVGDETSPEWLLNLCQTGSVAALRGFAPDYDIDGKSEVVTASWTRGDLYIANAKSIQVVSQPANALYFGQYLTTVGDTNGDGFPELAVSANGEWNGDRLGRVYIYRGGPSGVEMATPDIIEAPEKSPARFGISMTALGDANQDGFADLLVGDGKNAYLYFGSPRGLQLVPSWSASGVKGLRSMAGLADVNGDQIPDLLLGVVLETTPIAEAVFLYLGQAGGFPNLPSLILPVTGSAWVTTAGDVNGDGKTDVLIGSPPRLHLGTDTGITLNPTVTLKGSRARGVGDLDKDGFDDVLTSNGGGPDGRGWVGVYRGEKMLGLSSVPSREIRREGDFGRMIAGVWDTDGTGSPKVAVSSLGLGKVDIYEIFPTPRYESFPEPRIVRTIFSQSVGGNFGDSLAADN